MPIERILTNSDAEKSQRQYPMNLTINASSLVLCNSGNSCEPEEGLPLIDLATKHAEIRIHPKNISARVTTLEEDMVRENLIKGLQELGILAGSGILKRRIQTKPFNLGMTAPRFLERALDPSDQRIAPATLMPSVPFVVPATGENLASGFPELFSQDPVTQRLREELAFAISNLSTSPDISLVMETPGIRLSNKPHAELMVNSFARQNDHLTEMRVIDISTAIQMAIQSMFAVRSGNFIDDQSATMMITSKRTKRGKRIAVSSIPKTKIALREVSDENDAAFEFQKIDPQRRSKEKTTAAISTAAVFRQLA